MVSFLIATPQTGIDSILATFSVLGLGFALMRPAAALITGVCGGLIVNRLVPGRQSDDTPCAVASVENSVLKVKGVQSALANVSAGTLTVTGTATESEIRRAVEQAGFEMH